MEPIKTTTYLTKEHHAELHERSAISQDQMRARGYASVTAAELPDCFADYQRRDGLLIPLRNVQGDVVSYQLKPTEPRTSKDGKTIKYETAANARQIIDVPTAALRYLANPAITLVITEGAKKVDAAVSAGWMATIGLQGVYGWRGKGEKGGKTALPDWESIALNGREVVLAFDSDVMTKASVRSALDRLTAFLESRGAHVRFMLLPEMERADGSTAKCGLDDWLASGHVIAEFQDLVVNALPGRETSADLPARLNVISMAHIESKPIEWLWPGWLPKGMLTLLGGFAGDGKSTITMHLAAALSRAGTLPDGSQAQVTNTLLLVGEDDLSHVVKPRLELHGGDMGRIFSLQYLETEDGEMRSINLRRDAEYLRRVICEHEIGLVVIDPLSSFLAASDRNNEGEVRDSLQPLVRLISETGAAVIGVMHIGKTDGQQRAMQRLMGSTAFTALARCVWMVNNLPADLQDETQPTKKILGVSKSNYAVPPVPLIFSRPEDGPIEFLGPSPIGIEEIFKWRAKSEGDDPVRESQTDLAVAFIAERIGDEAVPAGDMERDAKEAGFSTTALRRARQRLGIRSVKQGDRWVWVPPVTESAA